MDKHVKCVASQENRDPAAGVPSFVPNDKFPEVCTTGTLPSQGALRTAAVPELNAFKDLSMEAAVEAEPAKVKATPTAAAAAAAAADGLLLDFDTMTSPLTEQSLQYLAARGISAETARINGIRSARRTFKATKRLCMERVQECIAFPYYKHGEVVCVKYRAIKEKAFLHKSLGSFNEQVLYGYDDIVMRKIGSQALPVTRRSGQEERGDVPRYEQPKTLIVVEGELDKVTFNEAGLWNVVSVPNGAASGSAMCLDQEPPSPECDRKFPYMHATADVCYNPEHASMIYLAVDGDSAGWALAVQLARRFGREKCFVVPWPTCWADHYPRLSQAEVDSRQSLADKNEGADSGARTDPNEVLSKDGAEALRWYLAQSAPIEEVYAKWLVEQEKNEKTGKKQRKQKQAAKVAGPDAPKTRATVHSGEQVAQYV